MIWPKGSTRLAAPFVEGDCPTPSSCCFAILARMDGLLAAAETRGRGRNDTKIMGDAGGGSSNAARCLLVIPPPVLGAAEVAAIHENDNGLRTFTDERHHQHLGVEVGMWAFFGPCENPRWGVASLLLSVKAEGQRGMDGRLRQPHRGSARGGVARAGAPAAERFFRKTR